MITIKQAAWTAMLNHARTAYPKECCGILVGAENGNGRVATMAVASPNVYQGDQKDRFDLDPRAFLAADKMARAQGLQVLGFFHSHPDCDAYFSRTDLENSWPSYSNVVMSIKDGQFSHAACFTVDEERSQATPEELTLPE
jgi:proteasome lid subunit RPN8/RPN11